jgi:ribose transport system ATP-binding protein
MSAIISIQNITKRFPGVTALADVTLDVLPGELHAICGENGAGKSTLMKILSGVITDYDGELLLRGKLVRFKGTRDAEAAGISIIHQELNLVEQLSAAANIFLGREIRGWLAFRNDRAMEHQAAKAALGAGVRYRSAGSGRVTCASAISSSSRSPRLCPEIAKS